MYAQPLKTGKTYEKIIGLEKKNKCKRSKEI